MSSIGTGYDLYTSQFSPDGRVFRVEYANKAVENSGTAVELRGKDVVVFAVEKIVTSKLYEETANCLVLSIDRHVGSTVTGLLADGRVLVDVAAEEAANYRSDFGSDIPLKYLVDRVSGYMHAYTLYSAVRPFGTNIMLGTYNKDDGARLYSMEPSGMACGYWGCASGKAKTEMEKLELKQLKCRELVKEAAKIIYQVHDEVKDKMFELELSWVTEATEGLHQRVPKEVFEDPVSFAKAALEEDSDSDEDMSCPKLENIQVIDSLRKNVLSC